MIEKEIQRKKGEKGKGNHFLSCALKPCLEFRSMCKEVGLEKNKRIVKEGEKDSRRGVNDNVIWSPASVPNFVIFLFLVFDS